MRKQIAAAVHLQNLPMEWTPAFGTQSGMNASQYCPTNLPMVPIPVSQTLKQSAASLLAIWDAILVCIKDAACLEVIVFLPAMLLQIQPVTAQRHLRVSRLMESVKRLILKHLTASSVRIMTAAVHAPQISSQIRRVLVSGTKMSLVGRAGVELEDVMHSGGVETRHARHPPR